MKSGRTAFAAFLTVVFVLAFYAGGCTPGEREATASGGDETKVATGTLAIDHVGFVPWGSEMYRIVARIKNSSKEYSCTSATFSATIFDTLDVVLGNDTGSLATVYPGQHRWVVSAAMAVGERVPAKSSCTVTSMEWKKIAAEDIPNLFMVQTNYIPTNQTDAKVTGIVRYSGRNKRVKIGLSGVLTTRSTEPVEATTTILENLTPGDYPFEMPFLRSGGEAPAFKNLEVSAYVMPF
jgi:hypothetical protein